MQVNHCGDILRNLAGVEFRIRGTKKNQISEEWLCQINQLGEVKIRNKVIDIKENQNGLGSRVSLVYRSLEF